MLFLTCISWIFRFKGRWFTHLIKNSPRCSSKSFRSLIKPRYWVVSLMPTELHTWSKRLHRKILAHICQSSVYQEHNCIITQSKQLKPWSFYQKSYSKLKAVLNGFVIRVKGLLVSITLFFLSVIVEMTLDFMKLDAVVFAAGNRISFQHLLWIALSETL